MFNSNNLQFNRGITSANAQGKKTIVIHTYNDLNNTTATIKGYFPPFLNQGATQDLFAVGDHMLILGSDTTIFCEIVSVSPFTLGANLFSGASSGLTISGPLFAVDNNGLILTSNVLQAELADATHPGILSAANQTIGGTKSFPGGVLTNAIDTTSATTLQIGQSNATGVNIAQSNTTSTVSGITINSLMTVPANVGLEYISNDLNIRNSPTLLSLDNAGNVNCPSIFQTNNIEPLSGTLLINSVSQTDVSQYFFNPTTGLTFPSAIGAGVISGFRTSQNISVIWTGPWATTKPGIINIVMINNNVILTISGVIPDLATHSSTISTLGIPTYVSPGGATVKGLVITTSGGAFSYGSCSFTGGTLTIFTDLVGSTFSSLGDAGFSGFSLVYNIDNP